jgi:hypothetical protein
MAQNKDVTVLRDLAKQVARIAAQPVQDERRDLWRRHNSLQATRPLVLSLGMPFWGEVLPDQQLQCQDPFFRAHERSLWQKIYQDRLNDDSVMEPWINVRAVHCPPTGDCRWGPRIHFSERTEKRGSFAFRPCVREERDLEKLVVPRHAIDEQATAEQYDRMQEAVGDIIEVNLDRGPFYRHWFADLSTDIARLLGLEEFMVYMLDRPAWLHKVLAFMRDGVLAVHEQAEKAGDWRLAHHENQAVPYAEELADPVAHSQPVKRSDLWVFCASQETTCVSPAMFDEFMLQYQEPIISKFAMSAYGCCEDLTHKIPLLRRIKNLRRISVTPWANLTKCVEQIAADYVISWRPNPSEVICTGLNRQRVARITREALDAARGCHIDITIKDHETLPDGFDSLVECIRMMKDIAAEHC